MSKRPAKPRTTLLSETFRDNLLFPGPKFDATPFALDLYRLLCMVLADKKIGALADDPDYDNMSPIQDLQDSFRGGELIRILISSAVALRILFDQRPRELDPLLSRTGATKFTYPHSKRMVSRFDTISKNRCGQLWSHWPKDKRKHEPLLLREACNKLIHADDITDEIMVPDLERNPDLIGTHIRPFINLYGIKSGKKWRARLSIVEFARHGAFAFFTQMPR
jgi:hypothetical protein